MTIVYVYLQPHFMYIPWNKAKHAKSCYWVSKRNEIAILHIQAKERDPPNGFHHVGGGETTSRVGKSMVPTNFHQFEIYDSTSKLNIKMKEKQERIKT